MEDQPSVFFFTTLVYLPLWQVHRLRYMAFSVLFRDIIQKILYMTIEL